MPVPPNLDLEPIRQALLREAQGRANMQQIDRVLQDLLEREFGDVRVPTFVPIFLLRAARDSLRERP
ncbi:MAG: hypothetical protein Q7U99_24885 [Rubrivivax sp.]|nr:hypothetical protein [Rubrivivax sp.]